jgi:hypothetical protein
MYWRSGIVPVRIGAVFHIGSHRVLRQCLIRLPTIRHPTQQAADHFGERLISEGRQAIMTATSNPQRSARPIQRDATAHLFTIAQAVRLRGGYGVFTSRFGDIYRITGMLPPSGNSLQYRIRNDRELHERVATEESLEPVLAAMPDDDEALRERTFGVAERKALSR